MELSQKAQERKATLNQTPDATDEEKNAANTKVDQALNDGIQQLIVQHQIMTLIMLRQMLHKQSITSM